MKKSYIHYVKSSYLPGKRKAKLAREAAATNPAEDAKNSGKGSSFPVHRHIEKSNHHHKDKPKVEGQDLPSEPVREEEDRSGEMQEDKRGVEDRPNEDAVDYDICQVAVICSIECKMFLQIQQIFGHQGETRQPLPLAFRHRDS